MRAPARAQDLILAHRVEGYRAGELERRYPRLAIEEAFFVNYGFLPRRTLALLHPRGERRAWNARMQARARDVLDFVRQHGPHPTQGRAGAFRPWPHQALGRRPERQRASAGGPAPSRALARGAARGRHTGLRGDRAPVAGRQPRGPARARRPAAGHGGAALRAAACGQPRLSVPAAASWSAAPGRRGAAGPGARQVSLRPCRGRRPDCGSGRGARIRRPPDTRSTTGCASSRPSTPWSGTGGASSCSGAGNTRWRRICRPTSGAWATTRCPCSGASEVLGWANLKVVDGRLQHELGFAGPRPRGSAFRRALDEALQRMQEFLGLERAAERKKRSGSRLR